MTIQSNHLKQLIGCKIDDLQIGIGNGILVSKPGTLQDAKSLVPYIDSAPLVAPNGPPPKSCQPLLAKLFSISLIP
jgi:hypothetical protein